MKKRRSSTEIFVSKIWAEVLKLKTISPEDRFFDLGGDSLAVINMMNSLNAELQTEMSPIFIFMEPSLRGFSRLVDGHLIQRAGQRKMPGA